MIRVGDHTARSLSYYYQAASAGELGAIINSFGFMELFSPNANARDMFRLKTGDKLSVRFES
ncbi:MAG: hypothetical protein IEMM0002_0542 [bacterium]|nr:MAG: hypothetical protein IEMM0002_0542 [bacterium]